MDDEWRNIEDFQAGDYIGSEHFLVTRVVGKKRSERVTVFYQDGKEKHLSDWRGKQYKALKREVKI